MNIAKKAPSVLHELFELQSLEDVDCDLQLPSDTCEGLIFIFRRLFQPSDYFNGVFISTQ